VLPPDHVGEIPLARDEAHERDVAVDLLGLDQLDELLHLVVKEGEIGGARRQPENELVEEEDDGVVAEPLGVTAEDGEPLVEIDEAIVLLGEGAEARLGQRVEERLAHAGLGGPDGGIEALARPHVGGADGPPGGVALLARVHRREEPLVAELVEHAARVLEELLVGEHPRQVRAGMERPDDVEVAPEDGALEVALVTDHVEAELKELRLAREGVLLAKHVQLRDAPRVLVAVEEERHERHEMRLTAAEAALKERRAATPVAERAADQIEAPVKRGDERGRHHVRLGGDLRLPDGARELLDEPYLVDRVR
jgi:hypothetical protein